MSSRTPLRMLLLTASLNFCAIAPLVAAEPSTSTCTAQSGTTVAPVVELYTSEGCSSCPPADRWLSRLKADPAIVALAFHVDYWDGLGWRDRFGSADHSRRQREQQAVNGARFSYTPQVVVNGRDRPHWYSAPLPSSADRRAAATVQVSLSATGEVLTARITPGDRAPSRLAAYWAVTEDGHRSTVTAGENRGEILQHDFVVRELRQVPAWPSLATDTTVQTFSPTTPADPAHPRHVNFVVIDAISGKPLQAIRVRC
ncbi:DUF1223 domain-containing protein [Azoarcus sp. L1K30]|uniref:DUF1223 domain-containing protein n=1 Tax=Azoarcus sp. L1K30 TaxID=2820277 RepID=UPI001B82669D|nr:DUF1223 domain-containing protein [Azoarcus sp. L1K30]MBR0565129.1 DUF1223 domain-containing protein [Azoarcus sp. L1K30]